MIPWTINEPDDAERLIGWGVHGLITDYPDRVRDILVAKRIAVPEPDPVDRR